MNFYINSDYDLDLDFGFDITGATTSDVLYRTPGSDTENTINGSVYEQTKVLVHVPNATNNEAGKWTFRAYVVIAGQNYYSDPIHVNVLDSWEPYL